MKNKYTLDTEKLPASVRKKLKVYLKCCKKADEKGVKPVLVGSTALFLLALCHNEVEEYKKYRKDSKKDFEPGDLDILVALCGNLPKDCKDVFGVPVYPNIDLMVIGGPLPTETHMDGEKTHLKLYDYRLWKKVVNINGMPVASLEFLNDITHTREPMLNFLSYLIKKAESQGLDI